MPTPLDKDLLRELPREDQVVRLTPEGVYMREKGKRTWFGPLAWSKIFWDCVNVQVAERINEKAEKRTERKLRRLTR